MAWAFAGEKVPLVQSLEFRGLWDVVGVEVQEAENRAVFQARCALVKERIFSHVEPHWSGALVLPRVPCACSRKHAEWRALGAKRCREGRRECRGGVGEGQLPSSCLSCVFVWVAPFPGS